MLTERSGHKLTPHNSEKRRAHFDEHLAPHTFCLHAGCISRHGINK